MTHKYSDPFDIKGPMLSYPLSLPEGLGSLKRVQLTNLCKLLKIEGYSSLNKSNLAAMISIKMPNHLDETFQLWDLHRVKIIQEAVKNNGRITKLLDELKYYEYFTNRGILFPTFINGKEAYLMPKELIAWFKEMDIMNVYDITRRNTEWIKLTMGLIYRYGALTYTQLSELVFKHAEMRLGAMDFYDVISDAAQYYLEIEIDDDHDIVSYFYNRSPEGIIAEHNFRSQLEFYPFTRQQLMRAGEPGYNEKSKHYEQLVRYLMTTYRIGREDAEVMVEECEWEINNLATLGELVNGFSEWIEFSSLDEMSTLTDRVAEMMNNTRQWALKGYYPSELSAKRQSSKPAVLNQASSQSGRGTVISLETKKKIGRNDPCPCGSGAKFKKCCGR